MRIGSVLLVLGCLLSAVSAQWLETTIEVDSGPQALCYNSRENKVYCANSAGDNVTVIDGATNQVIATVATGRWPAALCYNPTNNKVYCANSGGGGVTVIDGAADTVIATVRGALVEALTLCYNHVNNKVYCSGYHLDNTTCCSNKFCCRVWVVDGAADTVIAYVGGWAPGTLCYNPQNNKVYCGHDDVVSVIDGLGDTISATVALRIFSQQALCYSHVNNKVYCAIFEGDSVAVIGGATDSVITTIAAGRGPSALCFDPLDDKVYCANSGSDDVTVADGAADTVIATVAAGGEPRALCYNPTNNKVYCANLGSDDVTVIDGASNQVLRTIGVGDEPVALCHNPVQNRVYVANYSDGTVSVIRDSMTAMKESPESQAASYRRPQSVVRGVLQLQVDSRQHTAYGAEMLDISGRKVLDLQPGPNDVRVLAPGVYFLRSEPSAVSGKPLVVRKVVVTR
ncbi:MAG: hypothetical protein R6X12_09895 [bacterium]